MLGTRWVAKGQGSTLKDIANTLQGASLFGENGRYTPLCETGEYRAIMRAWNVLGGMHCGRLELTGWAIRPYDLERIWAEYGEYAKSVKVPQVV